MSGARGPLSASALKIGGPNLKAVGPNDPPPQETAATRVKPLRPKKPTGMPKAASEMWDEIVDDLETAGMLARCDAAALELALRHYAAAVKAANALMRSPVTQRDKKNDRSMKNPASQVMRDHSMAFLEFAKQLGLTFVSRARTPVGDQEGSADGNVFG